MIDKNELCRKIRDGYPDIGECGIDVDVEFDETNRRWVVGIEKGVRTIFVYSDRPGAVGEGGI